MTVRRVITVIGIALIVALAVVLMRWGMALSPIKAGLIAAPPDAAPAEERTTIQYMIWGRENEVRREREKLEEFVARNPDVQVELVQAGGTNYQVKLATMLAGGVAPDVFMVHEAMFPTLAENELILPLDDLVTADPDVHLEDFFESVVDLCRYEERLYQLPVGFNTVVLYYNKDMFDEAGLSYPTRGWGWDDVLRTAKALTITEGNRTVQYGVMGVGPWLTYLMMMWQNGGEVFDEQDHLVIGKPEYIDANTEALQFCADLQLEWEVHPSEAALETLPANPFVAERVAMNLSGTWLNAQIRGRSEFRWGIAHPPEREEKASLVFGGSPVIYRRTEHPDEAWRLLKAMIGEDWQRRIAREARNLPAKKSVAEGLRIPGIPKHIDLSPIFEVVTYAQPQPVGPQIAEWMEQPISDLRDRVLLGSVEGEEIRDQLERMQERFDLNCPYCSTPR